MAQMRVERRLAAILAADIVGYSRLIEADEAGTLASVRRIDADIRAPLLEEHRGRIVKLMGDGAIVEFASAVDAVACALALQKAVAADQAQFPSERRIAFRIGINLGDVVVEGGDLFGDGVNVATRLEGLAEPGGIAIADAVHRQLLGKPVAAFEDTGERSLKNIAHPVRVWRWIDAPKYEADAFPPLPDKPSIAVLPLDNLGGQPEETYFSDGITEEIITGLARFRSLFVVARNSSFALRGKPLDLSEIGRRLGVSYLLEGSVRRGGNRIRVTAQLIEAATGMHVWAERYDRDLDDLFAVQDQVARQIVSTLVGRIQDDRLQHILRKPTSSLAAYDCLLRGLAHFRGYEENDNQKAYDLFKRATELDPNYALAYANLANAYLALNGNASASPEVLETAFAMASHAFALDPQEGHVHRIFALVWLYRRDYDAAERHYRRAVELNPNDADRIMALGYLLTLRGKFDEALAYMEEAVRLNPFQPIWYCSRRAVLFYSLKRYAEAAQEFKQIPNPGAWSRTRLAACYGQLGRKAEAEAQIAAALREEPGYTISGYMRDVLLERSEDREHLREGLVKAGLPP
jgi:TolB-like protein/class 3 adenylate cyclase/Flp pilus assembly protein TadD